MQGKSKATKKKSFGGMTYICINILFFVALIIFYEIRYDRMAHLLNGKTIRGYIALIQAVFMGVSYCLYKLFCFIYERNKKRQENGSKQE